MLTRTPPFVRVPALLPVLAWTITVTTSLNIAAVWATGREVPPLFGVLTGSLLVAALGAIVAERRGYYRSAAWCLVLIITATNTVGVVQYGVDSPSIPAFVVGAGVALLLLGARAALVLMGVSITLIVATIVIVGPGLASSEPLTPAMRLVVLVTELGLLLVLGVVWMRRSGAVLRHERTRTRVIVENILEMIFILDRTGTILYASPSTVRVLGRQPEELVGTPVFDIVHPEGAGLARVALREVVAVEGAIVSRMVRLRHADGSYRRIEASGRNMLHVDGVQGVLVTGRDVEERMALEERLTTKERLESLGRLAGGVAHDFNNLLTAMIGYTDLLRDRLRDQPDALADVKSVESAAFRARDLTHQLLAFARRQAVEASDVDVGEHARGMLDLLRRLAGSACTVELTVSGDPVVAVVDTSQLEQILLNLVTNARDAMPDGGPIRIRVAREETEEGRVRMEVEDEGVGIPPQIQGRIFEPFFTTKGLGHGTGLGLASVYGVIQQSGGEILVDSEEGRGTRFTVLLPAAPVTPDGTGKVVDPRRRDGADRTGYLLIVEDRGQVRELTQRILEVAGYATRSVDGFRAALEVLAAPGPPPDLLVTDVDLPWMSGVELAAEIRRTVPGLPVLFLTGYITEGEAGTPLAAEDGRSAMLTKPFTRSDLLLAVRRLLEDAEHSRDLPGTDDRP